MTCEADDVGDGGGGGTINGSGTAGRIAIFADPTTIGDSTIFEDLFGSVGIGTITPNEQLEITGNFRLPQSTATDGVIKSDGNRFIHNFGTDNFFPA